MSIDKRYYARAQEIIDERKQKASDDAEKNREIFFEKCPDAKRDYSNQVYSAINAIKVIGMGSNAKEYLNSLKEKNLNAQLVLKQKLVEFGFPENFLEEKYFCEKCKDTGKKDGKYCDCFKDIVKKLQYDDLCSVSSMKLSSFDDFDLSYYPYENKTQMKQILDFCISYATNFDLSSVSLLFSGSTGLGKTHLSLAIAREAVNKGFGVVYGSAQSLFSKIEREHFGKANETDGATEKALINCDLLILDDLGAEFATQFTTAILSNLINERMLSQKPTIISTNLTLKELEEKYSKRVVSRIIGEYTFLQFVGNDIRQIKAMR